MKYGITPLGSGQVNLNRNLCPPSDGQNPLFYKATLENWASIKPYHASWDLNCRSWDPENDFRDTNCHGKGTNYRFRFLNYRSSDTDYHFRFLNYDGKGTENHFRYPNRRSSDPNHDDNDPYHSNQEANHRLHANKPYASVGNKQLNHRYPGAFAVQNAGTVASNPFCPFTRYQSINFCKNDKSNY